MCLITSRRLFKESKPNFFKRETLPTMVNSGRYFDTSASQKSGRHWTLLEGQETGRSAHSRGAESAKNDDARR